MSVDTTKKNNHSIDTRERIYRNTYISRDWSVVNSPVFSRHCPIASRSRTCPEQFLGVRRSLWEIKMVTQRDLVVEGCFHPTHSSGLRRPAKRIRRPCLRDYARIRMMYGNHTHTYVHRINP